MFHIAQNNHQWNAKYYELLDNYNKLKSESENKIKTNASEIEHLNKMVTFLKNKNAETNKTLVEKNKQIVSLLTKLYETQK
jgi:septal ring factor EnvC (AmiA/AmiB activator)